MKWKEFLDEPAIKLDGFEITNRTGLYLIAIEVVVIALMVWGVN